MNTSNISKEFLRATQRCDLNRLKALSEQHHVTDWTVYRHEVSGDTALHIASREGYLEITDYLCNNWTKPDFRVDVTNKDMKRPLHEAAQFSQSSIVEFLIKQGASIDSLKRADWTPLMLACTKDGSKAFKCVTNLINAGASGGIRNKDGWTPLHIAARVGNPDIIQVLLEKEPNLVISSTNNGRTTLHIAAFHGCIQAINILISKCAELKETTDSAGCTPIFDAVKSMNFMTFLCLINHTINLKKIDSVGQSILHIAVTVGNIQVIEYILKNKLIDVNCVDAFNLTPLDVAQTNKFDDIINLLLSYIDSIL